ncbi:MAG: STAS domain-containing protein [Candidatus Promineofilum sp.]|nr:STAS domain-containing protein [Promineifilum sp.]
MSVNGSQPNVWMQVRQEPGVGVIAIRGEMTGFAEEALMTAYNEASHGSCPVVVLDFSALEYMNSTGIGLLVTLLIRAQRQGQRLLACGLSEHYRQIFDLTRLNEAIGIYESQEEALAAVAAF